MSVPASGPPKRRGAPKGTMPPNAGKGRPKGIPNKASGDVRKLAQLYGPDAILGLAIMAGITPPVARLPIRPAVTEPVIRGCMDSLLDRAYGKATQPLEHSVNESVEGLLDRLGR
jgi:hypothetical protein